MPPGGERSVLVRVRANMADLRAESKAAAQDVAAIGKSAKKTETDVTTTMGRIAQSARRNEQAWTVAGRSMVVFGAVGAAALLGVAKAAIDWESAFAGVEKTVDGTDTQLAKLEGGLRNLATTLPATHGEIAAVAEAAGQLGVRTQDILGFTRVMVDLGETTNLTAAEAATSLAQFMNVMGTAPEQVSNLGSALVELGNNGASTERDIVQMAQRIAGAAAIVGLAESDVLGIANAVASAGVEVEAGGSAISRTLVAISKSVSQGGEDLDAFAKVAGVSAAEFARSFRDDPATAFESFIAGLGGIAAAGGDVFTTLEELGLADVRVSQALLGLANNSDFLTQSLDDGARAFAENSALAEEAAKRYDTTAARIDIAKNSIVDAAISLGEAFLPAIAAVADALADFAGFIGDLPAPLQAVALIAGGLATALGLLGGAFLLMLPRILETKAAFAVLGADMPKLAKGMSLLGKTAGVAGGLLLVAGALEAVYQASLDSATGVGEMTDALLRLRQGQTTDAIDRLIEKRNELADRNTWLDIVTGMGNANNAWGAGRKAADELAGELESVDLALSELVAGGNSEAAEEAVKALAQAWEDSGGNVDHLMEKLPGYADALKSTSAEQQLVAEVSQVASDQLAELGARFALTGEDAAAAAQELLDSWSEGFTSFVDIMGAYDTALAAKEERERLAAETTAESTSSSKDSWEDYFEAVTLGFDEYLAELEAQVTAQAEWAANMLILSSRVSDGTIDELARLGPEGAPLVAEMVNASDAELARFEQLAGQRTASAGAAMAQRLAEAGPVLTSIARSHGQAVADSIARGMAANSSSVYQEAAAQGVLIDRGVGTNRVRTARVVTSVSGVNAAENTLNFLARDRTVAMRIQVIGGTVTGGKVFEAEGGIVANYADGGIHPPRPPMIAAGGQNILWAEPEAGRWEAYIPENPAKRQRALSILGDVADRFGYQLLKANAMRFADGGTIGAARRATQTDLAPFAPQVTVVAPQQDIINAVVRQLNYQRLAHQHVRG